MSVALTHVPRRARLALAGACLLAAALVAGGLLVYHSSGVAHVDTAAFYAFTGLAQSHRELASIAWFIANLCDPGTYALLVAIPVVIALLRGRVSIAVAVVFICVAATQTSEVLKPLLSAPRPLTNLPAPEVAQGSWPSGHSTAAMALALSMVLAVPRQLRPVTAALGGAFALIVAYCVLLLGWHYPSDALGGMAMAAFWTLVAVAAVAVSDAHWGREHRIRGPLGRVRLPSIGHLPSTPAVLAAAALPAAAMLLLRAGSALSFADEHTSFVAVVIALACVALANTVAVVAAVGVSRGSDPAARAVPLRRSRPG